MLKERVRAKKEAFPLDTVIREVLSEILRVKLRRGS